MSHLPARIAEDIDRDEWDRIVDLSSLSTTDYQFDRFVVGQHDTVEARAQQAALEAVTAADEVRRILRDRERARLDLADLEARWFRPRRLLLDIDEKRHEIEQHDRMLVLRLRRWAQAVRAVRALGEVTVADLEAAEPERWRLRLERQAALGALDRQTGAGVGNLDALRQIERIEHHTIRALAGQLFGLPQIEERDE